MISIFFK